MSDQNHHQDKASSLSDDASPRLDAAELRRRAGEKIMSLNSNEIAALSVDEMQQTFHELRVHQIELEMQNEELRRAHAELDEARARYLDLYDFAPVGYCTISEKGLILEANLTAATLLGQARGELIKQPITRFILPEDQNIYFRHRKQLFETWRPQICELRMERRNSGEFWARLDATAAKDTTGAPVCRVVIIDHSESKRAEINERLTREVLDYLTRSVTATDAIRDILSLVRKHTGFEAVGIRLREGDDFPYYHTEGFPDEFVKMERYLCARDAAGEIVRDSQWNPVLECMCGNILRGRTNPAYPFFTEGGSFWSNCTTDLLASTTAKDRQARTRNRCNGEGYESVALIPLRTEEEIIGLLQLNDHRRNQFTPGMIHFLEGLGASIGIAFARKRAEETLDASHRQLEASVLHLLDTRQELEESNRQLLDAQRSMVVMSRIRQIFLTVPDEEMYSEVMTVILDVMESDYGVFGYIDYQGALVVPPINGVEKDLCAISHTKSVFPREEWDDRSWSRAIREKKTIWTNDASNNMPQDHVAFHRHISLPIIHQERVVGLFQVANKKTDYTREDVAFLEAIGRAVASVLDARLRRDEFERERERLLQAIEQAGEMFVITDHMGTIQYVNPAFESITGYTSAEAVGKNPRFLKSGRQDHAFYQDLWKVISSGRTWHGQMVNKRKDGSLFTDETTISPVRDGSGQIVNYVAVKHDITENLRLAAQARQSQKMEIVGRLAGGVAHDYNNKLNVILGYTEMAMEKVDPSDPIYDDLREVMTAARRSTDITRQLLAFARKQTISLSVLDLNGVVEGMLKMLRRLMGEDIRLAWLPDGSLWPIKMDSSQIDQILVNLCVNARDAITDVGNVTVETENASFDEADCGDRPGCVPGDFVMLAVSDDGCGISKADMRNIFEPFFTTKEIGEGTGLGLATVYGIVKQNNGFIYVYSEPGEGTAFKIYLPRYEGTAPGAEKKKTVPIPKGRGETVLVVEDEAPILKLADRILQSLGYTVLTAKTSVEALSLAERNAERIELLVTDVVMPEMNGRELADRMLMLRPDLKILFMSGYTAGTITNRGVVAEGVNFMQKPFSMQDLATAVRNMLGE